MIDLSFSNKDFDEVELQVHIMDVIEGKPRCTTNCPVARAADRIFKGMIRDRNVMFSSVSIKGTIRITCVQREDDQLLAYDILAFDGGESLSRFIHQVDHDRDNIKGSFPRTFDLVRYDDKDPSKIEELGSR